MMSENFRDFFFLPPIRETVHVHESGGATCPEGSAKTRGCFEGMKGIEFLSLSFLYCKNTKENAFLPRKKEGKSFHILKNKIKGFHFFFSFKRKLW